MVGNITKDCRAKGEGKGKGRDEGKAHVKGSGKAMRETGRKGRARPEEPKEEHHEERKDGYIKDSAEQGRRMAIGSVASVKKERLKNVRKDMRPSEECAFS